MIRTVWNSLRLYLSWLRLEIRSALGRRRHVQPTGRHVLLVVEQFPPSVSGGVYRPLSFAKYAHESGWTMTVDVSGGPYHVGPVGEELRRSLPPQVAVFDRSVAEPALSWKLIPHLDGGFYRAIRAACDAVRLPIVPPDVVLATGPTFHTFVTAYFVRRLLGGRLVLDYRDEWTACPFEFVEKGRFNTWWERRCLAAADLVVFTTPSMREHALERFPGLDRARTRLVENGVDFEDLAGADPSRPPEEDHGRIKLVFVGNLADHTRPDEFLLTLAGVLDRRVDLRHKLRVIWVGHKSRESLAALERSSHRGSFECLEQVSRRRAFELMQRSTLLLLIVNREMDRYRPGKLYDYLASDVPILVYGSRGESGAVVEQLNAGFVVQAGDGDALEAALDGALVAESAPERVRSRQDWIRRHDRRRLAKRLFEALDDLRPTSS